MVLQQRLQQKKMEQYARAAQIAQQASHLAVKGQEAVGQAGGTQTLAGAGVVGAGAGLLLAGPLGALAGGAALAYSATTNNGLGEVSRSMGQAAVSGLEAVKEFDGQHQISAKAMKAFEVGSKRAREVENRYRLQDRIQEAWKGATSRASNLDQQYNVIDRVGQGLGGMFDSIATKLGGPEEEGEEPEAEVAEEEPLPAELPDVPLAQA